MKPYFDKHLDAVFALLFHFILLLFIYLLIFKNVKLIFISHHIVPTLVDVEHQPFFLIVSK